MNKAELVANMAEMAKSAGKEGTKKEAEMYLNAFMDTVKDELVKGEKVQLVGFGTFEVRERKARKGRNPRNPEQEIEIPESKAPVFKAGKSLKEAVNE
ncbi:DNA-binding protein HU-beta [Dethiosulfatibacter aminovorans DSM 17477]|uniref:DNA-binding protein HU-beta n=1 Tax=Dethiosulfatibacter aminovorans DSM 17477 TaxID=1121476 RepID=A0A1M6JGG1_9FIRM|nr:HU family DNA-binding protein [Dethiosulfatibacter aminovorans]SHJ45798.1 DNA-binding protein HU-beta [Dethiosulfatibacter aminovorans DSM 17477]